MTATNAQWDELHEMVKDIDIAMLTTVAPDGSLVSRPMSTLESEPNGHLWFMTSSDTHKVDEIERDARTNLAYYDGSSRGWLSVAGRATVVTDRSRIHEFYSKTWKLWLGDEGGAKDGGPDDPRIRLIDVKIESAVLFDPDSKPKQLFEMAKAAITGEQVDLGEVQRIKPRLG